MKKEKVGAEQNVQEMSKGEGAMVKIKRRQRRNVGGNEENRRREERRRNSRKTSGTPSKEEMQRPWKAW